MLTALEIGLSSARRGWTLAAVDEDALHRLGDAVAADLLRPEACHEAHDQTAERSGSTTASSPRWFPVGRDQRGR